MPSSSRFTPKHSNDRLVAEGALDALADGYVVVSPSWYILFENPASERMLGAPPPRTSRAGRLLWDALPAFAEEPAVESLRATMIDAKARTFPLVVPGRSDHSAYNVRVTANPSGGVCIQLREGRHSAEPAGPLADDLYGETAAIRDVARALAEEMELDALLQLICAEATAQTHADGATIGQLDGDQVEVVAASGIGAAGFGFRFPLVGSLTERAFTARTTVRADDYVAEYPALAAKRPAFQVGPVLMVPLIAQSRVLGVLMLLRRPGAPRFTEADEHRTRVIADHAALAMRKAQLFEEAQEANRAKSEFMATMSHELRTPLTALTGYEELLVDEVFGPLTEQQLGAVERMRTSTELLTVIIDEILTFPRLEAGEEPVRPRTCTAQEIVRAAAAVLEPLVLPKQLDLVLLIPDAPMELFTDPDMVRRILVNLGANAVKFTESGSVELSAACHGDSVHFSVRDTGMGIAERDLPRLFRPFTQLDSGFTRRHGGTGLGLFISQRLASLLGGEIEVDSTVGEGSVFTVVVPKNDREQRAESREQKADGTQ